MVAQFHASVNALLVARITRKSPLKIKLRVLDLPNQGKFCPLPDLLPLRDQVANPQTTKTFQRL